MGTGWRFALEAGLWLVTWAGAFFLVVLALFIPELHPWTNYRVEDDAFRVREAVWWGLPASIVSMLLYGLQWVRSDDERGRHPVAVSATYFATFSGVGLIALWLAPRFEIHETAAVSLPLSVGTIWLVSRWRPRAEVSAMRDLVVFAGVAVCVFGWWLATPAPKRFPHDVSAAKRHAWALEHMDPGYPEISSYVDALRPELAGVFGPFTFAPARRGELQTTTRRGTVTAWATLAVDGEKDDGECSIALRFDSGTMTPIRLEEPAISCRTVTRPNAKIRWTGERAPVPGN